MLTHRLDPMQPQRMQHGRRALHDNEHGDGEEEPHGEKDEDGEDAEGAGHAEGVLERHVPEHDGELLMREREGPEAEVGGRVGDAVEAEF